MDLNTTLLIIAALLPAVILCVYVYKKDKVEKEPTKLLFKLFIMGVLSCFPAYILEKIILGAYEFIFYDVFALDFYTYNFIYYFFGIALIEEGLKWLVFRKYAMEDENFNCMFDGLIYAIFISLGFAAFENILYVLNNGWMNALMRGILSVPGHMFFSVMMGYHLSQWKIISEANRIGAYITGEGRPSLFNEKKELKLSIIIPVIIHGVYNYCCSMGSLAFTAVFIVFIIFLYIFCFKRIKEMSVKDDYNISCAAALVMKEYPDISRETIAEYIYR